MNGWWGIALGVVLSFAVNEVCDVSPWLARRIVPLAARLWTRDPERREIYTESWIAVIDERPGKLFKLATALGMMAGGAVRATHARAAALQHSPSPRVRALVGVIGHRSMLFSHCLVISNLALAGVTWAADEGTSGSLIFVALGLAGALVVLHSVRVTVRYVRLVRFERSQPAPPHGGRDHG